MSVQAGETLLLLNEHGRVEAATPDPAELWKYIQARGDPGMWLASEEQEQENPADRGHEPWTAEAALTLTGLSPLDQGEVMRLSPNEAYELVRPIFEEPRAIGGRGLLVRKEVTKPLYGLLTENFKLSKADPGLPPTVSLGLSLLPEFGAFRGRTWGGVELPGWEPTPGSRRSTLCMFSSPECRSVCLVYSGQNQSDWRNNLAKAAKSKALLTQPVAFARLLVHALERYATSDARGLGPRRSTIRAVRLNVFSDIPWEVLAPWLLEDERIVFYDYTKVPGRALLPHYDLTFSYSGSNLGNVNSELVRGRRVAMVFAAPEYLQSKDARRKYRLKREKAAAYYTWNPLPEWVQDPALAGGQALRVRDGDMSDFRWYEPGRVVVGLRWKLPRVKVAASPKWFVVRGKVIESDLGRVYLLPESPLSRPRARGRKLPSA